MDLGQKIRTLRKQAGFTLQVLSKKTGLGLGTLSRIEHGKAGSTIRTHQKLCEAFGISLAELYRDAELPGADTQPLTLASEEVETFTYDEKASSILLAKDVLSKNMLPQLLVLKPGGRTHQEQNRPGTERWLFVLEGAVEVTIGERRQRLSRYGTLYFKASIAHQFRNPGKTIAKCLSVTSPVGL